MTDKDSLDKGNEEQVTGFTDASDSDTSNTNNSMDIEQILKRDRAAQQHIKVLEAERKRDRETMRALEEKLKTGKKIEDIYARMRGHDRDDDDTTTQSEIDVDALVDNTSAKVLESLGAQQRKAVEAQNFGSVVDILKAKHGDKYLDSVRDRAKDLNIPLVELDRLAKTSPKAFFELYEPKRVDTRDPKTTRGTIQQPNNSQGSSLAEMYKVRETNINLYRSPEFQKQLRARILEESQKSK